VLLVFAITAAAWITRGEPFGGWSAWLGLPQANDASVALLAVVVMCLLPDGRGARLLDWERASQIPWGVLLLFAGGICLARGFVASGLSGLLGDALAAATSMPTLWLMLLVCLVVTFMTETTSQYGEHDPADARARRRGTRRGNAPGTDHGAGGNERQLRVHAARGDGTEQRCIRLRPGHHGAHGARGAGAQLHCRRGDRRHLLPGDAAVTRQLRIVGVALTLAAFALLYPGVTQPVLTLEGELEKAQLAEFGIDLLAGEGDTQTREMLTMMSRFLGLDQVQGRVPAYRETRSVLGMSRELAGNGNLAVAVLIVTFSILIPGAKLLLQLAAFLGPPAVGLRLLPLNAALSKWSMADVFVMAMLVAFMAGRASGHMGELLVMNARLEVGFWYFLAYCLFAIGAGCYCHRWSPCQSVPKAGARCHLGISNSRTRPRRAADGSRSR
jgi:hypothetical protein